MSDQTQGDPRIIGMPPTSSGMPTSPPRTRAGRLRTLAAFGVLGAAVAGTATIVMAASPSPSPAASPGASSQSGRANGGWAGPGAGFGSGGFMGGRGGAMGGRGGFGPGGIGPGAFDQITVAGVNGSAISLKTADGWTRTITVSSSTTITKGGKTITAADVATGDTIRFTETRNTDGSFSITSLQVVVPEVDGTVTSVTGSTFQLKDRSGVTWTVTTNGSTSFNLGPSSGSLTDVTVGATVDVARTQGSNNAVTALSVRVEVPTIVGQVTAKTATTLTIQRRDGTTVTVHLGSPTTYTAPNVTSPSLSTITVGSTVAVSGTQRTDGSFDALQVSLGGTDGHGPLGNPGAGMPQG